MTPTKLLVGQIAVVLAIILASIWAGTQYCASMLGYQPELGPPWFELFGVPVYQPFSLFLWWYHFDAYAPEVFDEAGWLAASGGLLGCLAAVGGSIWRARQARNVTTYGSARWATLREARRAGLLRAAGLFIGQLRGRYLRHDGSEHILAFAPTRSGKGVGLVVPTLLSWTGSTVVHDIKGENWHLTAGWRSRFSHVLRFDPTDLFSAHYNPLLEVRRGDHEVRDVQNIADILVDPEGALERRNHWEITSHALLVGAILHVLYAEEKKTLAGVAAFLSDPQRSFLETLDRMMTTNHLGTAEAPKVHPVVASAARELLDKSENERSGVLSTAISFLELYRDPIIAKLTSTCDWRIADLINGIEPVSLYLVIPPSDISRTKPLIRLILNQIGRRLTETLEDETRRHKLLLMLDEFPALGRLDFFETSLAFLAGYGVRAFLIAQSLNQIEKAYGEHNTILDNCHIRIAFATNDERTARRISDALGVSTEQRAMRNYAGHRLSPWLAHVMVSRQETARPLLTQGEILQLPGADEIVLVAGMPPIRARKLRYYEDDNFKQRVQPPPKLHPKRYPYAPPPREDDWGSLTASVDPRLSRTVEPSASRTEGRDKQRQRDVGEQRPKKEPQVAREAIEPECDDQNVPADQRQMGRAIDPVIRASAMDQGRGNKRDLV